MRRVVSPHDAHRSRWSPTRRRSTASWPSGSTSSSCRCRSSSAPSRTTRAPAPRPDDVAAALAATGSRSARAGPRRRRSCAPTRSCAKAGAEAIVSVHLSGEVSGTFESARAGGARRSDPGVTRRQPAARDGRPGSRSRRPPTPSTAARRAEEAAEAARERAAGDEGLFYVDTLEYLRRGGRVGAAAALVGSALAVKPLLQIEDGRIVPLEKVRTVGQGADAARGARRRGRRRPARSTSRSSHLANPEKADALADAAARAGPAPRRAGRHPGGRRHRRPRRPGHARRRRRPALTLTRPPLSTADARRRLSTGALATPLPDGSAPPSVAACSGDGPLARRGRRARRRLAALAAEFDASAATARRQHAGVPSPSLQPQRPTCSRPARKAAGTVGQAAASDAGTSAADRPAPRARRPGRRRGGRGRRLVGVRSVPQAEPVPLAVARSVPRRRPPAGSIAPTRARHRLRPPPAARPLRIRPSTGLVVDVAGKVRRPGIVELPAGSRVVDALAAAGGARPACDTPTSTWPGCWSTASRSWSGSTSRLRYPGRRRCTAAGGSPAGRAGRSTSTPRPDQLETLPGIGPVTAQAILDWRTENGAVHQRRRAARGLGHR